MICTAIGCYVESPGSADPDKPRLVRDRLATEAGWRHFRDGKTPALNGGAALCPTHAADPKELAIAIAPRTKKARP